MLVSISEYKVYLRQTLKSESSGFRFMFELKEFLMYFWYQFQCTPDINFQDNLYAEFYYLWVESA